jgi:hypothetical protein
LRKLKKKHHWCHNLEFSMVFTAKNLVAPPIFRPPLRHLALGSRQRRLALDPSSAASPTGNKLWYFKKMILVL